MVLVDNALHLRASLPVQLQLLATSCLLGVVHDPRSQDLVSSNAAMFQALTSRVMQRSLCER